jgi:hypothetical protein
MAGARRGLDDTDAEPATALALQALNLINEVLICDRRAHRSWPDRQRRCYQCRAQSQLKLSSRDHYESSVLCAGKCRWPLILTNEQFCGQA